MSLENTEIIEKLYKENDLIKIKNLIWNKASTIALKF